MNLPLRRGPVLALFATLLLHGFLILGPGWHLGKLTTTDTEPEILMAQVLSPQPPPLPRPPSPPRHSMPVVSAPLPAGDAAGTITPTLERVDAAALLPAALAVPAAPQIITPLPANGHIRYIVRRGEGGMVVGRAVTEWHHDGHSYRLTSTTETTGIVALFRPARVVQTSEGRLEGGELYPRRFVIDKGDGDVASADFDWAHQRVTLGDGRTLSFSDGAEDMLSMFFQLMAAAQREDGFQMAVATGRKVERYAFEWLPEETLSLPAGRFKTWHVRVRAVTGGGDSTEVWLAEDAMGLPVRIRHIDRKGELYDQDAEKIEYQK
ncbi:MAG: DUF3108 domain-containing protein [Proteobacteria bacterium]|nr:DUF3108 domain-containing protein [Pseudomonadota bacterium]HQR03689.1 DUF3108 domain-containing protein [Rhodocyclaceae bacterium]